MDLHTYVNLSQLYVKISYFLYFGKTDVKSLEVHIPSSYYTGSSEWRILTPISPTFWTFAYGFPTLSPTSVFHFNHFITPLLSLDSLKPHVGQMRLIGERNRAVRMSQFIRKRFDYVTSYTEKIWLVVNKIKILQ